MEIMLPVEAERAILMGVETSDGVSETDLDAVVGRASM
jgi:hypothetical protein